MPLFEYECRDCGRVTEVLLVHSDDAPECGSCGGRNLSKLMSAHTVGASGTRFPGAGDTGCCGQAPGMASGCAGPGSCCGKA